MRIAVLLFVRITRLAFTIVTLERTCVDLAVQRLIANIFAYGRLNRFTFDLESELTAATRSRHHDITWIARTGMAESRATMRASRITFLLATYFTAAVWRLKPAVFGIGLFAAKASVFVGHGFTRVLTVRTTPLLLVVGKRGLCPFFNAIHVEHLIAHGAIPYGRIGLDY